MTQWRLHLSSPGVSSGLGSESVAASSAFSVLDERQKNIRTYEKQMQSNLKIGFTLVTKRLTPPVRLQICSSDCYFSLSPNICIIPYCKTYFLTYQFYLDIQFGFYSHKFRDPPTQSLSPPQCNIREPNFICAAKNNIKCLLYSSIEET